MKRTFLLIVLSVFAFSSTASSRSIFDPGSSGDIFEVDPVDCAANTFANAIAINGDLTCSAISDADVPDTITIALSATATALASDPSDCGANTFATAIAASGNLTCSSIVDADIPDTITIDLAATATALASDPTDCAANNFATTIAASGNLACAQVDIVNGTTSTLTVARGGTGATTLTDGGILLGSGTGAVTALGVASNGQIPIGDGTTDPVLAAITGTADQVTVTNGAGSITLSTPASHFTGTGTLDFDLTASASQDLTIAVTGAALGDAVAIGVPNASVTADTLFWGWVSATNTVTVRAMRIAGTPDPASGTFRADVFQ